jgi:hypothetical protein
MNLVPVLAFAYELKDVSMAIQISPHTDRRIPH